MAVIYSLMSPCSQREQCRKPEGMEIRNSLEISSSPAAFPACELCAIHSIVGSPPPFYWLKLYLICYWHPRRVQTNIPIGPPSHFFVCSQRFKIYVLMKYLMEEIFRSNNQMLQFHFCINTLFILIVWGEMPNNVYI